MIRVALAAVVAVVTGAGTTGAVLASGGSDGPPRALSVDLDEWRLTPSSGTVAAGAVSLSQLNSGRQEHELLIVRTELPADDLPLGLEGVSPAAAGKVVFGKVHRHHTGSKAKGRHLQPGESKRRSVRLAPGRYVLLCSIPGHYEAGQRAALTVQ